MKPQNKGMLVRGKIVVGTMYSGSLISESNPNCLIAVTHWYRHDDNLSLLEKELKELSDFYMTFKKSSGVVMSYEYKEYKK